MCLQIVPSRSVVRCPLPPAKAPIRKNRAPIGQSASSTPSSSAAPHRRDTRRPNARAPFGRLETPRRPCGRQAARDTKLFARRTAVISRTHTHARADKLLLTAMFAATAPPMRAQRNPKRRRGHPPSRREPRQRPPPPKKICTFFVQTGNRQCRWGVACRPFPNRPKEPSRTPPPRGRRFRRVQPRSTARAAPRRRPVGAAVHPPRSSNECTPLRRRTNSP